MFRGRGNSRFGKKPFQNQQRGLFADGIWQCDCDPRLPAEHFKVKKDGKNHGRWFYTCQKAQDERCGFFLWDEDAKPREESAVLANSRTEAGRQAPKPDSADANPTWQSAQRTSPPSGKKRKASPIALSDTSTDDDGGVKDEDLISWPATGAQAEPPVTPRKHAKTDPYPTPVTTGRTRRLPWLDYSGEDAPETPSRPARTTELEAALPSPETGGRVQEESLAAEVMALLERHGVELGGAAAELRALLARYEGRLQGAVKGREMVRAALRARDARVVQLQARIAGAEAEVEVLRRGLVDVDGGGGEQGGRD